MQVAAAVIMMTFRDTETEPWSATIQHQWVTQRQRHGELILENQRFNWDVPDRYVEVLNFKLEVKIILELRAYKIKDEENVLVIKNCLGKEGLLLMEMSMLEEKEKCKTIK